MKGPGEGRMARFPVLPAVCICDLRGLMRRVLQAYVIFFIVC
jgi:hypothetical protein